MICRACYREVGQGGSYCPHCGASLARPEGSPAAPQPQLPAPAPPAAGAGGDANPWESRAGRSAFTAFAETLQQSLFRPVGFFRATAPDRGAGAALWYSVLVGTLAIGVALLWQRALGEQLHWQAGGRYWDLWEHRPGLVWLLFFVPPGVALGNLIWAAVVHVALAVLGGARGTYTTTLKAVCYSSSATAFNVFPVCGAAIGVVWQAVVQVIGLRELHRTTTARALWAWLLPFVVALCLAGALAGAALFGLARLWQEFGGVKFEV